MRKIFLFASVAALALGSCKKEVNDKDTTVNGESKTFQHGKAWTWYQADRNNRPIRIAIAIDEAAMNSLEPAGQGESGHHHANSLSLALPAEASVTPFKHVMLDWNPDGHPPDFYLKPHFDFHFYTTTEAERLAIPPYEVAPAKFDNVPPADYLPANYFGVPEGVPQMGKHWVDPSSPEFTPAGFSQTFLYGTYDGKVTFYEPMITEEFIKNNQAFSRDIPLPSKFQQSGWYPTKMRLAKVAGVTSIILENFVQKQAS